MTSVFPKKSLVLLPLLLGAALSHADPTTTLNQPAALLEALDAGQKVSVTIDLSRCQPQSGGRPSQTKGGLLAIDAYRVLPDGTISFADTHFTASDSAAPLFQTLRYQVKVDGSVNFRQVLFSLPDYALVSQSSFNCAIGNGVEFRTARRGW